MSITPFFRDWWDDLDLKRPHRLFDQHFGSALRRDELWDSFSRFPRGSIFDRHHRPWTTSLARQDSGSTITADQEKFQVILDVQQFVPSEITVKTNGQNIIIEGKHEEKQDEHGFISRHFLRRYVLPQDHDVEKVVSSLSSDGVLTVSAPKRGVKEVKNERIIPITQTGPAKATVTPIIEEK